MSESQRQEVPQFWICVLTVHCASNLSHVDLTNGPLGLETLKFKNLRAFIGCSTCTGKTEACSQKGTYVGLYPKVGVELKLEASVLAE